MISFTRAFSEACGHQVPYKIESRRPGDIGACFADPSKAREELGFAAKKNLKDMCEDAWRWQNKKPDGYKKLEDKK